MIKKECGVWNVYTEDGKRLLGSHTTKTKAKKQLIAIHINQAKRKRKQ